MYITSKEILDLREEVQKDLDDYEYYRKKRVPIIQGEDRIMLLYVIELLNKLLKMLKRGNYSRSRIIEALENQDWVWYSYNKKSLYSEKLLKQRMQYKPSKKIKYMDLILKQSLYLQSAGDYIIQRLE